jgi:hypothetical protein
MERHYKIYGDNIVECVRAFDYIVTGLGDEVVDVRGPLASVTCPVYIVRGEKFQLTFQFLPGYGERRWNQDVLTYVQKTGGRLREAADAIVTLEVGDHERPIAAIEFCGALPAGNQAWQRQGRAFSFAHAQIPYFYVAELGGFELAADRERKAERLPNPAVPFSFLAMTRYQGSVCLPVYAANLGARAETAERYDPVCGTAEFLAFLKEAVLGEPTERAAAALEDKSVALVALLADSKKRQDGLSGVQWREAGAALRAGRTLPDYLFQHARLKWRKKASIRSLTQSARRFMALGAEEGWGLVSSIVPLSFVPKDRRAAFVAKARIIYPDLGGAFGDWLARSDAHLAIAWVMGFKPGGNDARPDRGLPPFARMLIGDETDLLTFIYGPVPPSQRITLGRDVAALGSANGLWEAILAVSDGLLVDGTTESARTPRGHLKSAWSSALVKEAVQLAVEPRVLSLGEQDVDTALHLAFKALGTEIMFEGMCNPPGGDWSGISFRWDRDSPEQRWLTLPRVSPNGGKRPDHVFAVYGHAEQTMCLCIESKTRARSLERDIGPRLVRYAQALFEKAPSIHRPHRAAPWAVHSEPWEVRPVLFVSAGAYLGDAADPFRGVPEGTNLDLQMSVVFVVEGTSCELHLRGDTEIGKAAVAYLAALESWGGFVAVRVANN